MGFDREKALVENRSLLVALEFWVIKSRNCFHVLIFEVGGKKFGWAWGCCHFGWNRSMLETGL